ncbi:hypothetical protein CICLE_v10003037mg [Citrus x clementina]|uniref:Uncharacterized protein n=2 Tax=Citrus TaxID=2706 RepID=A0A067E1Q7_CITSI|nr:hypothetical protein CICLE_v10003037mg [Citrus x clementina]KDO47775.1 hypothetical protein CISIN_1g035057mg [Citrus sinensis]
MKHFHILGNRQVAKVLWSELIPGYLIFLYALKLLRSFRSFCVLIQICQLLIVIVRADLYSLDLFELLPLVPSFC